MRENLFLFVDECQNIIDEFKAKTFFQKTLYCMDENQDFRVRFKVKTFFFTESFIFGSKIKKSGMYSLYSWVFQLIRPPLVPPNLDGLSIMKSVV